VCVKADKRQPGTAALEQWLRAVCDETGASEPPLAADSAAAADFHEARDLVAELRTALQPEPLPEALVTAIHTRIRRQSGRRNRVVRFIAPLAVAAAATLAMAITTRYTSTVPQAQPAESAAIVLSTEDAADIVAANVLLSWEGQFQASVSEIATEVGGLREATERISQAGGSLPWSAEDDWDAVKTEGQSRAGFDCRA
jgi:hypothetical protein